MADQALFEGVFYQPYTEPPWQTRLRRAADEGRALFNRNMLEREASDATYAHRYAAAIVILQQLIELPPVPTVE